MKNGIALKLIPILLLILSSSGIISSQNQNDQNLEIYGDCGPAKIVFIGASNMATFPFEGWVKTLVEMGFPWTNNTVVNSAKSGNGIFSYFQQSIKVKSSILNNDPDYLLINLGGNDFLQNPDINATQYKSDYKWLIDYILNNEGGQNIANVFLMNIIWAPKINEYTPGQIQNVNDMQTAVSELATDYNFTLIDSYNVTRNRPEFFENDGIHLLNNGYLAVAGKVHEIMAPIIIANHETVPACSTPSESTTPTSSDTSVTSSDTSTTPSMTKRHHYQLPLQVQIKLL